jgi:hypothetical protein
MKAIASQGVGAMKGRLYLSHLKIFNLDVEHAASPAYTDARAWPLHTPCRERESEDHSASATT